MEDSETLEIRQEMEQVRRSLGCEVGELVESARTLADWHHYLRKYPWLCVGGAAAVGFLLVPKRVELVSPNADVLEELARRNKLVVSANPKGQAKAGLGGTLVSFLMNTGMRAAMGYIGQNAGEWFGDRSLRKGTSDAESNRR